MGSQGKEFRGLSRIRDTTSEKDEVILKGSDTLLSLMDEGKKRKQEAEDHSPSTAGQRFKDSEELSPHLTTTWTLLIKEIPLPTNKQGVSYQKTEKVVQSTHFTPAPIELPIITGISK